MTKSTKIGFKNLCSPSFVRIAGGCQELPSELAEALSMVPYCPDKSTMPCTTDCRCQHGAVVVQKDASAVFDWDADLGPYLELQEGWQIVCFGNYDGTFVAQLEKRLQG